jgi:hypothetical protein
MIRANRNFEGKHLLGKERTIHTYDVALWVVFPSLFPEYVDLIEAPHAYIVVQLLMACHGLRWVAYAGVRSSSGVPHMS